MATCLASWCISISNNNYISAWFHLKVESYTSFWAEASLKPLSRNQWSRKEWMEFQSISNAFFLVPFSQSHVYNKYTQLQVYICSYCPFPSFCYIGTSFFISISLYLSLAIWLGECCTFSPPYTLKHILIIMNEWMH